MLHARQRPARAASPIGAPRITIVLPIERERLFAASKVEELREFELTPQELMERACELTGYTIEQIALDGALERAKKIVATMHSSQAATARAGIIGAPDDRLRAGYAMLVRDGKEITPARLGSACDPPADFRTAKRWLRRNGLA